MNYSDLDMNIDNYELHDLLDLFHLDYNFNEEDLKKTKKTVLMTHPDKSKLPSTPVIFPKLIKYSFIIVRLPSTQIGLFCNKRLNVCVP